MSNAREIYPDIALADTVARCADDAGFLDELGQILRQADVAAEKHNWACRACGKCCRFDQFGHKLYVTGGELAYLTDNSPIPAKANLSAPDTAIDVEAGLCPYQRESRCVARDGRALGCRLFFCDPAAADWFCETYEALHEQIKHIHAAADLPYVYVELTAALAELYSPEP